MSDNNIKHTQSLKYKTKKGLYWTFINNLSVNVVTFVVGIIMARLLDPSDYGLAALPAVFLAVANTFTNGGFDVAMIRKSDLSDEDISTAFYYSVLVGLVCYFILYFCSPFIADFYDAPILEPLVRVSALAFIFSALTTPQSILLTKRLDFKTPAIINFTTQITASGVALYLAFRGYGIWSLVVVGVLSKFLRFVQTWLVVKWIPKSRWSKRSFDYLWKIGNKLIFSNVLNIIHEQLAPIIIGKFYSPASLGYYNRANGYAMFPATQVQNVVQQVSFPVLSGMQDNMQVMVLNYRRIIRVTAFIIFPVMFFLAALAKPLIILMLTEKWAPCAIYMQLICLVMVWYPIGALNTNMLRVTGRTDMELKLMIKKKIIGIFMLILTLPFGVLWFCAGQIVTQLINTYLNIQTVSKISEFTFFHQIKDIKHILILSLISALAAFSITILLDNLWLQLIIGGMVGSVIYGGVSFIFKFKEINDVIYLIQTKKNNNNKQ